MATRTVATIAKKRLAQETGAYHKDWGGRIPIALLYPNRYSVGMSSLGFQTLYHHLNADPQIACERAFWEPPPTLPFGLESQSPLADYAVVACSIAYELDYLHLVDLLRRARIPLRSEERGEEDPIILAGGVAVSANPVPLAPIVDAFVIGEAEPILPALIETLKETLTGPRQEVLQALAQLPGLYVPSHPRTPVQRLWLQDLDTTPTHSVLFTPEAEFGDMALLEIGRGCGRGCRFCLAGFLYRPPRYRSIPVLLEQARHLLTHRPKLGLVSAAVSDHPQIDPLVTALRAMGAKISVSSLRVDPLSDSLLQALAQSDNQTLTIAPEAGSERLRRAINKGIDEAQILHAVERAAAYHFPRLKLYAMIGLPTETDQDIDALISLALTIRRHFPGHLTLSIAPFVPKPHTPFQTAPMADQATLKARLRRIQTALRPHGIHIDSESPQWSELQTILSRGDETVAQALLHLEAPTLGAWHRAARTVHLDPARYLGPWPTDTPFPWQIVTTGVTPTYLQNEARRAEQQTPTPPCPPTPCTRCGVCT